MFKKNVPKCRVFLAFVSKNFYFCASIGPVVQLNRTSDSGSEGRGFESRRDHKA